MQLPFKKNEDDTPLDVQINAVLDEMSTTGVDSEKYPKLVSYLERLHALKQKAKLPRASRDTWIMVGGNILIAITVLAFEQKHVWTSKVPIPLNKTGKT